MNWYALYKKPRHEYPITFRLQNIGIEVLRPKIKTKKYKCSQVMEIIEPLFPCYLFANFDKDKYLHMFTYTKGVRYIIGKSNLIIVYGEIINTIKENIKDNDIITLNPQSFKKGDRVFIKEGPFKDFYGIFERETKSFDRVVILLDIICYKVELDSCFLTKCTL